MRGPKKPRNRGRTPKVASDHSPWITILSPLQMSRPRDVMRGRSFVCVLISDMLRLLTGTWLSFASLFRFVAPRVSII